MNHKHVKKNIKKEKAHFGSTRGTEIPRAVTTHFSSLIIKPLYFLLFTFWGHHLKIFIPNLKIQQY